MTRVLGVCGSLQAQSGNLSLLQAAARSAPSDVRFELFDGLRLLPHFDPDLEAQGAPAPVLAWRRALAESDGLMIASPEYGHSLPGVLKNGIDWAISSGELEYKVVVITCAVPIAARGRMGLQALRQTLNAVSAHIVSDEPVVKGPGFEREATELLLRLIEALRTPRQTFRVT